jgi:hypothetical protein
MSGSRPRDIHYFLGNTQEVESELDDIYAGAQSNPSSQWTEEELERMASRERWRRGVNAEFNTPAAFGIVDPPREPLPMSSFIVADDDEELNEQLPEPRQLALGAAQGAAVGDIIENEDAMPRVARNLNNKQKLKIILSWYVEQKGLNINKRILREAIKDIQIFLHPSSFKIINEYRRMYEGFHDLEERRPEDRMAEFISGSAVIAKYNQLNDARNAEIFARNEVEN